MSFLSRRRQAAPSSRPIAAAPGVRLVLHVGCGKPGEEAVHERFRGPGWQEVRLDVDPGVAPDIVASITDMSPVADATVDAVYSHHNIEHVFSHEVPLAMREFFRVLKPGGEVMIATPDLQNVARTIASGRLEDPLYRSGAGNIAAVDIVYGLRSDVTDGREYMAHRTGFTRGTLARKLGAAGFVEVDVRRAVPYALWASARRPLS